MQQLFLTDAVGSAPELALRLVSLRLDAAMTEQDLLSLTRLRRLQTLKVTLVTRCRR